MRLTKRFNYLVKTSSTLLLQSIITGSLSAQSIDLRTCHELAEQLSPLKRQEQYLASIDALNRYITQSRWLPDVNIQGRASYQSDVFSLPFSLPGSDVPQIPKDQYQLTVNLSQNLYDGGATKATKIVNEADHQLKQAQLEVSLYQVKSTINELYFSILSLEENQRILQTMNEELDNQLRRANSALKNGLILPSELKSLQKEKLKTQQQINELEMRRRALLLVLSDWTGQEITSSTKLELPETADSVFRINRPELRVFSNQTEQLQAKKSLISSQVKPRLSAFATAGYGSPNPYNFFEVDWNTFYIIGGRLDWKLWDWNSTRKQREVIGLNQQVIQSERENFEKNIRNELIRKESEARLIESSLDTDTELLNLQKDITKTASARFEEGVITATDYLSELHALTQAELQYRLHQVQLAKMKIEFQTISGNMP